MSYGNWSSLASLLFPLLIHFLVICYHIAKEINIDQLRIAIALASSMVLLFNISILILTIACYGSKITTIGVITPSINDNAVYLKSVYAQTGGTKETSSKEEPAPDRNNVTTFSAIGQISSMVITVPDSNFNITNAFKVILTGDWNLSVNNGTMTNFGVNFLASPMDGGRTHVHQITNFKPYSDEQPITLAG
jgi:hypothetical protein